MQYVPLVILGLLMYALVIYPQQKRTREHRALLSGLNEGDEVLTNAGVYGFVNALSDDVVWLEVADGVELRVSKTSVASKIEAPTDDLVED